MRLLMAARKSRSGGTSEDARYLRQDTRAAVSAEHDGHTVIQSVHDTVTSQSLPWERKNLKAWMTLPELMAMYDGILISETDRLSRLDDKGWHYIEGWCYANGKVIVTAEGVQFPPRDDSDRYQWIGLKRRARTYWEDVRDKYKDGREMVAANSAASGRPPYGYRVAGDVKYAKWFEPDPVTGPVLVEIFSRVAEGQSIPVITDWLEEKHPLKPQPSHPDRRWRNRTVTRIIRNASYLGERDGHKFERLGEPVLDFGELWGRANAVLDGRSVPQGGRPAVYAYSSVIFCPCGAKLYRQYRTMKRSYGTYFREYYLCCIGRRGIGGEEKCAHTVSLEYGAVNQAVDQAMRAVTEPEIIAEVRGGDHARQRELASLKERMEAAMAAGKMGVVGELSAQYTLAEAQESQPIVKFGRVTGRTIGDVWAASSLTGQRALLKGGQFRVTVLSEDEVKVESCAEDEDDDADDSDDTEELEAE